MYAYMFEYCLFLQKINQPNFLCFSKLLLFTNYYVRRKNRFRKYNAIHIYIHIKRHFKLLYVTAAFKKTQSVDRATLTSHPNPQRATLHSSSTRAVFEFTIN